ncbi:MAG: hypothetical protein HW389_2021 [Bacteroidetes bacterium]|nr:hypothetical protein [Bacteroidota bacterium]
MCSAGLRQLFPAIHQITRHQLKGYIHMKTENSNLLTAGAIAKQLAMPDTKVKKAIADLKIKPTAKKGVCNYYSKDVVAKVKAAIK